MKSTLKRNLLLAGLFTLSMPLTGCAQDAAKPDQAVKPGQPVKINRQAPRPNIILILLDDLGYADVGFNGSKEITTPALDNLAQSGTIFSSAYVVHAFCGPSRMGLVTGRYPHEFGGPYNLPNAGQDIEQYNNEGVPTSEKLFSSMLQDAGYYTGAVGKWHMGVAPQFHPNVRGFDDFYGFLGGGHDYFPEKYQAIYARQVKAGKKSFNEYIVPLEHNGKEVKETEYLTDGLSREGARFITEAAKKQPFFLYMSYNAPHTPLQAKDEDLAKFADIKDEKRRTYAAMVYAVDRGVERLVKTLKDTGTYDNTLIVFLSDNGGKLGAGANNRPLAGGKGDVTEGGFRVPMFFHWPDKVKAGARYNFPVTALDFYPTFAHLAGSPIPAGKKLDGKDLWDAFEAGKNPREGGNIYVLRHHLGFNNVGIRQDKWKALKKGPRSWMLFDLDADIGETKDLSEQHPALLKTMVGEAATWSQSHVEPRWFDNLKAAQEWKDRGMPNYDKTFDLSQQK